MARMRHGEDEVLTGWMAGLFYEAVRDGLGYGCVVMY